MVNTLRELVDKMEENKKAAKLNEEEAKKTRENMEIKLSDLQNDLKVGTLLMCNLAANCRILACVTSCVLVTP